MKTQHPLLLIVITLLWAGLVTAGRFPSDVPAAVPPAEETGEAPLQWPLDGEFLQGFHGWHRGIDIGAPYGTPVGAAAEGWVAEVAYEAGYGNYVFVVHYNGIGTLYSHLAAPGVEYGQWLNPGDLIGWVGATGWATTTHVHFEVFVDGVGKTDPLTYLP